MIHRYRSLLPMLAAAAFVPFSWSQADLGAQTPARPPVPPSAPTPAAPVVPPRPARAPMRSPAPRALLDWYDNDLFDHAFDARAAAAVDAAGIASRVSEQASERSMLAGVRAAERASAAVAMSMDHMRDFSHTSDPTPMAALAPMPPVPPNFSMAWDDSRLFGARAGSMGWDDSRISSRPPEAWMKDDPADSLYREARKALTGNSYRRAAELFRRIRDQYPKSTYTPDAPYWEAFALQRLGNESDLRAAQEALSWQLKQYPKAATRGDATALATSIDGALARRGDQSAYNSLVGRVGNVTSQGCARDEEDERVAALNALARMDSAQFLPVLKKVLARRETCTQALRRTAVWLYARSKAADAPQVLMNVAKTDPDREVRDQAVFWMANVPTEEAVSMLIDLARNGSDMDLRKRAVYALSRSKSTRATATLRDVAADANSASELRIDALQWYMSSAGKTADDAMSFLRDVYGKADDQRIRERVLQLIANRKTDEAREFLTNVAQNTRENIDTRRQALSSLQNAGATAAQVAAIYDRGSNDIEIRKQAIGVLAGLKDNSGIDKLLDVARNEKNLELRKQAVSYLSRTKDPRAVALLQEIILR